MTVKILTSIPFTTCKSIFLSRLASVDSLPQRKELNDFILQHNSENVYELVVNHQYCSLDELKSKIIDAVQHGKHYLYLAVNKFYIYSTVDSNEFSKSNDYDSKLVDFCYRIVNDQYFLIKHTVSPDDDGNLGNFVHPVTTMFFEKYV